MLPAEIQAEAPKSAGPGQDSGPRRAPGRPRSIRLRIIALLIIPLLSLIALWAFAAAITGDAALNKFAISALHNEIGLPAAAMHTQLAQERAQTTVFLSTDGTQGRAALDEQRRRSDAAVAAFRRSAQAVRVEDAAGPIRQNMAELNRRMDTLGALRSAVDGGRLDTLAAIGSYAEVSTATLRLISHVMSVDDRSIYEQERGLIEIAWAREYMAREDALVSALVADGGRIGAAERTALVQWAAARRHSLDIGLNDLRGQALELIQQYLRLPDYQRFVMMEQAIIDSRGSRLPATAADWSQTVPAVGATLTEAGVEAGAVIAKEAEPIGDRVIWQLVIAGGLGLLAVIASIVLSVHFGRGLARELRQLQRAADELADHRLPEVVGRLRRGEEVDADAAAPPLETGRTAEVARVATAFDKVRRTAVETAVSESHLRKGVSRVFLNLAWRSQSLLHRQLRMLDAMERRVADPDILEDLFRVDHLTTRMRRHAEGLIILSGAAPGRAWSRPVPIEDVLRSAVAEVEDFTRVDVIITGPAALAGAVVADITHLIAELVENATQFSPPPTEVLVKGEMVANGYAIDVVDRGIGIDPHERSQLNQRLAEPPEFDLADTDRLGLFVVARLAARHGIRVALQESVYGGTCAVVLLPHDLVSDGPPPDPELAAPARPAKPAAPVEPVEPAGSIEVPAARSWFEPRQITANSSVPDEPPAPAFMGWDDLPSLSLTTDTAWNAADGPPPVPDKLSDLPLRRRTTADSTDTEGEPAVEPEPGRPALPRRVRQANLAAELRGAGPAEPAREPAERSAEENRNLLSSLQGGWLRGRADDAEDGAAEGAADGGGS